MTYNPFILSGYVDSEHFCDREQETKDLIKRMTNGVSTTITAIRRIGKTGLIKHALKQLPEGYIGIYIDILATENLNGFNEKLMTAIAQTTTEKSNIGTKIWSFIRNLRPLISYDALTGSPQIGLSSDMQQAKNDLESSLLMLEALDQKVVIAIDEFQQILNYPEKNVDAYMRTIIQNLSNVVFVFSGSMQHVMNELFTDASRPFYRSTQLITLDKIEHDTYRAFIAKHFQSAEISISNEIIDQMLAWTNRHTFYVQVLCNRVFSSGEKTITPEIWKHEAWLILKEQENIFFRYRDLLSKQQWELLKAIAIKDEISAVTSAAFIQTFKLNSSATVLRSLDALLKKEMVYETFHNDGKKTYAVYDLFLKRWIQGGM